MDIRPRTEAYVRNIVDVMSGDDGGVGFMAFKGLVEDMDKRAAQGDQPAKEILAVIQHFSQLLDSAKKWYLR